MGGVGFWSEQGYSCVLTLGDLTVDGPAGGAPLLYRGEDGLAPWAQQAAEASVTPQARAGLGAGPVGPTLLVSWADRAGGQVRGAWLQGPEGYRSVAVVDHLQAGGMLPEAAAWLIPRQPLQPAVNYRLSVLWEREGQYWTRNFEFRSSGETLPAGLASQPGSADGSAPPAALAGLPGSPGGSPDSPHSLPGGTGPLSSQPPLTLSPSGCARVSLPAQLSRKRLRRGFTLRVPACHGRARVVIRRAGKSLSSTKGQGRLRVRARVPASARLLSITFQSREGKLRGWLNLI